MRDWLTHTVLDPVPDHLWFRGEQSESEVSLRYLGTAGFVVETEGHTLVIDPFVTRPDIKTTLFRPMRPNAQLVRRVIPKADDILVGHSHHDHLLDAPTLSHQTGARIIGSPDTANVARAAGVPESLIRVTHGREDIETASGLVHGVPSAHGRIYGNRVPLPGPILEPPSWPARLRELRCGMVFNWYIEIAGRRIMHIDSAEFFEDEIGGFDVDVLCLCAIGRRYRPNYVTDAIRLLKPQTVIACHWDWFFTDYDDTPLCLPGIDLEGFTSEIADAGSEPVVLPFDASFAL